MAEKKQVKTISFRADFDTLQLLQQVRSDLQKEFGFSVTNSDILRKALEHYVKEMKK